MVLVDSTAAHKNPVSRPQPGSYSVLKHVSALVSASARLGVGRLIAATGFSDLPPQSRDEARASAATAKEMGSFIDEFGVANRSESEAGQLTDLDGKPLVVLTAERGNAEGWIAAQDKMATLSTNSVHRVVPGSTHDSLMSNPHHAAAVIKAIDEVVASIRTGRRGGRVDTDGCAALRLLTPHRPRSTALACRCLTVLCHAHAGGHSCAP